MAYTRRLGADDGTILMACSICGFPFRWPEELRLCPDKLFRCNVFCTETTTPMEESRKQGSSVREHGGDEAGAPFPVGPRPGWYP